MGSSSLFGAPSTHEAKSFQDAFPGLSQSIELAMLAPTETDEAPSAGCEVGLLVSELKTLLDDDRPVVSGPSRIAVPAPALVPPPPASANCTGVLPHYARSGGDTVDCLPFTLATVHSDAFHQKTAAWPAWLQKTAEFFHLGG